MSNQNKKFGKTLGWVASIFLLLVFYALFEKQIQHAYNPNHKVETRYGNDTTSVRLEANQQGHYVATGYIGRYAVTFLVDTGATLVALPQSVANRSRLPKTGTVQSFNTANGIVQGYLVNIPSIEIGGLVVKNVKGAIMPDQALDGALLGVSFLKNLTIEQKNNTLILRAPND